jgi:hypothetical protein
MPPLPSGRSISYPGIWTVSADIGNSLPNHNIGTAPDGRPARYTAAGAAGRVLRRHRVCCAERTGPAKLDQEAYERCRMARAEVAAALRVAFAPNRRSIHLANGSATSRRRPPSASSACGCDPASGFGSPIPAQARKPRDNAGENNQQQQRCGGAVAAVGGMLKDRFEPVHDHLPRCIAALQYEPREIRAAFARRAAPDQMATSQAPRLRVPARSRRAGSCMTRSPTMTFGKPLLKALHDTPPSSV